MVKDSVLKLGFTEAQIALHLPPPTRKRVKQTTDNGKTITKDELHYDDKVVWNTLKFLNKTVIKIGKENKMTPEAKVKAKLVRLFKKYDVVFVSVVQSGLGSSNGFPDYQGYDKHGVGFAVEVKSIKGKLTALQQHWFDIAAERNAPFFLYNGTEESERKLVSFLERELP